MGLGSTAKKVQTLAERAEQVYAQIMELREQINELRETVEATGERVDRLDRRSQEQWVVIQELAAKQGIDVEELLAAATIEDAEPEKVPENGESGEPSAPNHDEPSKVGDPED